MADDIRLELRGGKRMQEKLLGLQAQYPEAMAIGLLEEGYALDANMVPRIPVDTEVLRSSHFVSPPRNSRNPAVSVGVGGAASGYALAVHEVPATHLVGEDKYLEKAVNERQRGFGARLAARVVGHVKAGTRLRSAVDTSSAPTTPQ